MKPPALLVALACSTPFFFVAAAANADSPASSKKGGSEEPKPIVGKAPAEAGEPSKTPKEPEVVTKVFDTDELGAPDKATVGLINTVEKKCFASPMSREGMSEDQTKRCNAAVAKLVEHGKAAIPGILAALDERGDEAFEHYYTRNRLYYVLAKSDDPRVEDVLLRGYARIATTHDKDFVNETGSIDAALATMNGTRPATLVGSNAIADDDWKAAERAVIGWRLWQKAHQNQPKARVRKQALADARRDLDSSDPKKRNAALVTLGEQAPTEAIKRVSKLLEREDLKPEESELFYQVQDRAYENGGQWTEDLAAKGERR